MEISGRPVRIPRDSRLALDLRLLLEAEAGLVPLRDLCAKYGYASCRTYYRKRRLYARLGVEGLIHRKRGPKHPTRRTEALVRRVVDVKIASPWLSAASIAEALRREGLSASARTVARVLAERGLSRRR